MKKCKIYLAGAMKNCKTFGEMNEWREYIASNLSDEATLCDCNLDIINPCEYYNFEEPRHQNDREVMQFDLAKVKKSDLVIVNLNRLNTSIGTAIELYECFKRDIPVIGYDLNDDYDKLHSWLQCFLTRVETNVYDLTIYVRDFYFL